MVEIYVSTDIEADGPIPGPHSMLSFASAAYLADKTLIGTFSANLETLPGAAGHPETMKWWGRRQRPGKHAGKICSRPSKPCANTPRGLNVFRAAPSSS